jgi:hypothetical protein
LDCSCQRYDSENTYQTAAQKAADAKDYTSWTAQAAYSSVQTSDQAYNIATKIANTEVDEAAVAKNGTVESASQAKDVSAKKTNQLSQNALRM